MRRIPQRYRVLVGCLICQMGLGLAYIFGPLLKHIVADLGWTRAAFSAGTGPLLLSVALASPLIGAATDRFGARRVLSLAALTLALALWLFSSMQSLPQLYATNLLLGLSIAGLGDIPVGAVAARWFAGGRGLALGVIYSGSNLGGAAVAIMAASITEAASWRSAMSTGALLSLLVILPVAWFAVREPRGAAVETGTAAGGPEGEGPALGLGQAMRTRSFWMLAAALFIFYFYYLAVNQHLVAFLSDSGLSDAAAARRFSASIAVGIAGKLGIGLLTFRVNKKAALLLNFALLAVGSCFFLAVNVPWLLMGLLLAHGFAVAAENVLLPLIVADCFGVRNMARIYGTLMLALLPGGFLGPVFAGFVFDTTGGYAPAFATFAALNAAGLGLLALVRRERERACLCARAGLS